MMYYLYLLPGILLAITLHEFAHGWMSWKLGDPTPKREGRLTLNPLKHLEPFGVICMLVFRMGWAKPVMINPYYYKNKKNGIALVSLAGPVMNLLTGSLAIIAVTGLQFAVAFGYLSSNTVVETLYTILYYFSVLSINLAVFNLIPLPPLDGSKILGIFLPDSVMNWFNRNHNFCMIVLLVALYLGFLDGPIDSIFEFIYDSIANFSYSIFQGIFIKII